MPLLVGCLAIMFPRLAVACVWLFGGDYLTRPYPHWVWPLLGFLFLPLTVLTFSFASNSLSTTGSPSAFGWLLVAIALLVDVGIIGKSGSQRRRERSEDPR